MFPLYDIYVISNYMIFKTIFKIFKQDTRWYFINAIF